MLDWRLRVAEELGGFMTLKTLLSPFRRRMVNAI